MPLPQAAIDHYRSGQQLSVVTIANARRLWRSMGGDFNAGWELIRPRLVQLLTSAQVSAAAAAEPYVVEVLAQTGQTASRVGAVNPFGLAGVAADGRPLPTLLDGALVATKRAVGSGTTVPEALNVGGRWLDMAVHTAVRDADRAATSVAITARPEIQGYVRMVNLPACSRCIILAGRWYRYNAGFDRHPRCLPAGVVVSGPATLAATRRQYEGELVVITTASGEQLPITGNHPVLTLRGWVPANLVDEGDHVLRALRPEGAAALVVPDHDQVPSRIEDLWRPDRMALLGTVPTTPEDFHGDGGHGEVDVVLADGLLRDGLDSLCLQHSIEQLLGWGVEASAPLLESGTLDEVLVGLRHAPDSFVGGRRLLLALLGAHPGSAKLSGVGVRPDRHTYGFESWSEGDARDAVAVREAVEALAGFVSPGDLFDGHHERTPRWDPPPGPLSVENRAGYASAGKELGLRLAGQVTADRVVEKVSRSWSGHVYNLTSAEGWFVANSLVVSNCDCSAIPAAENIAGDILTDPKVIFASLSTEQQDSIFTGAGAKAIRDGADMNQVVNARRGLTVAGSRLTTTEGTTKRGFAGQRLRANGQTIRLMPEGIYDVARDRDEAIALLRSNGFLL